MHPLLFLHSSLALLFQLPFVKRHFVLHAVRRYHRQLLAFRQPLHYGLGGYVRSRDQLLLSFAKQLVDGISYELVFFDVVPAVKGLLSNGRADLEGHFILEGFPPEWILQAQYQFELFLLLDTITPGEKGALRAASSLGAAALRITHSEQLVNIPVLLFDLPAVSVELLAVPLELVIPMSHLLRALPSEVVVEVGVRSCNYYYRRAVPPEQHI